MNSYKYIHLLAGLLLGLFLWGCTEDTIAPALEELRNESFDLVVISDGKQYVPVSFSVKGSDVKEVTVEIMAQGGTEVIASNALKNIRTSSLSRVSINVPFPSNDVAPTGIYTVSYKMSGETVTNGSYEINVINNVSPVLCDYTDNLPSGASVWIRLYVPEGVDLPEEDDDIFLTGSFGTREGGSDWDGGGDGASPFKFNQLDNTCYELAINLETGDNFKITRGTWDKEMANANGSIPGNFSYNGESEIVVTAYNWKDRETVEPETEAAETLNVPAEAIKPGMLTFVADVSSAVDVNSGSYYVIEKGATNLEGAYKMTPFEEENMLAAAVPKKDVSYVVVKDEASATGTNSYGFEQSATWDGQTNPAKISIGTFDTPSFTLGEKIVIVGAATPGDWGASSGQDFTKTGDGTYEIVIDLNPDSEYLLLPDYGGWDQKWAYGSGDALSGTFDNQGSGSNLFTTGIDAGSYKISVDFRTGKGSYQLSKQ